MPIQPFITETDGFASITYIGENAEKMLFWMKGYQIHMISLDQRNKQNGMKRSKTVRNIQNGLIGSNNMVQSGPE